MMADAATLLQAFASEEHIAVCEDESTCTTSQHSTSCTQFSNPDLEPIAKRKHPNHHIGPIDLSYEQDSQRRCKSFFKRRKTIFDKANQLTSICGASVSIKLKSQAGHLYEYRSGEFQPDGLPGVPMVSIQHGPTPRGRPKKTPVHFEDSAACGHPQTSSSFSAYQPQKNSAPCAICKKANSWLVCQKPGCSFWAHARCLGFVAMTPTDMSNVKFFCPKHIPAS